MSGSNALAGKLRDKIVELLIASAMKNGLKMDEKTQRILELTADIVYATIVFIMDAAKNGGNVEKTAVQDFLIGKFTKQFSMIGNSAVDCVASLASFAADVAVLAPTIDAALGTGTALTVSGAGAPIGLSVIGAALIASAYLSMQAIEAANKCQDAVRDALSESSSTKAGNSELTVDTRMLSDNALNLFNLSARRDRSTVAACSL